jgi:L-serine kinase (ADP)
MVSRQFPKLFFQVQVLALLPMKNRQKITLIDVNKLKCHEQVVESHVEEVIDQIKTDGYLKRPVIAEDTNFVILDGHHRFTALKRIGAKKIPVYLVHYKNNSIRVYLRRKELLKDFIKEIVLKRGAEGILFPPKTTRHLIKNRPKIIHYSLNKLI